MRECLVRFRDFFSHLVLLLLLLRMFLFCSVLHLPLNDSRAKVEGGGKRENILAVFPIPSFFFSSVSCDVAVANAATALNADKFWWLKNWFQFKVR